MSRLLIATVGTSLLTNPANPWGWKRGMPLPIADDVDLWFQTADFIAASAETNTLQAVRIQPHEKVRLLHSATDEGLFCAERLRTALEYRVCSEAKPVKIEALSYQSASFAQIGLRSLVSITIAAIHEAQQSGLEPVLCATGGFKAEIAFLNLLGALLQIEVNYIHEQFREVVRLPRLPLSWDAKFVERHRDFFEWIDAEPRHSVAVEGWLKGRPELRPLVDDSEDGHSYLNAAGDMIFRVAKEQLTRGPRAIWPPNVPKLPQQKNGLSVVEHHRPKGWDTFVSRLCEIDCVERVAYDATAASGDAVRVIDGAMGRIAVRFENAGNSLPLVVFTSARDDAQSQLVAEYIRGRLK